MTVFVKLNFNIFSSKTLETYLSLHYKNVDVISLGHIFTFIAHTCI